MRWITILFIFLSAVSLKAQTNVYHPFPDSNAVWSGNSYTGDFSCYQTDSYDLYISSEDTTIGLNNYKKLRQAGYFYVSCSPPNSGGYNNGVIGYLRQDTALKQVFFLSSGNEELIYDFNLNVGDTLTFLHQPGEIIIVTQIDSILIANNFRKKFILNGLADPYCPNSPNFLIEGIGSSTGLLNNITCFFEGGTDLGSFCQSGQALYPSDWDGICGPYVVDINELKINKSLKIYPNPATTQITIEFQSIAGSKQSIVEIYSSMGQLVFKSAIQNPKSSIDVSGFTKGLYLIKVLSGGDVVVSKVVVE